MERLAIIGLTGRMGTTIGSLAAEEGFELVGGVGLGETSLGVPVVSPDQARASVPDWLANAHSVIDFSGPAGFELAVALAQSAETSWHSLTSGSTGFQDSEFALLKELATRMPVLHGHNMSLGINLLQQILPKVTDALGLQYDVEIVDIHHNQKKDSPSGTAISLADAVQQSELRKDDSRVHGRDGIYDSADGPRPSHEIGIHALRAGDVIGDHTVYFCGPGERIELTHRAHSRETFARGALRAARFLLDQKAGQYTMADVLGL